MRVIVCGTRSVGIEAMASIALYLGGLPAGTTVVTGGARGVDAYAEEATRSIARLESEVHPAEWEKWGPAAGPIRNREMLRAGADRVVAFWDGRSRGTRHMIEIAQGEGVPVEIIPVQG